MKGLVGFVLGTLFAIAVLAYAQTPTPCEDLLDTSNANYAQQLFNASSLNKENRAMKAKIAELEKQLADHKGKK